MGSERAYIPIFQHRPNGFLMYYENTEPRARIPGQQWNFAGSKQYTGEMSPGAIRRLKRAVTILAACAKWKEARDFKSGRKFRWKVNFITLTLSAAQNAITDSQVKLKCFDPFLKRARRKYKLVSYVWRAERQENGNIHFHLMTDCYFHFAKLRYDWNQCQNHLGFIDEFENEHGHRDPNSTDVHAVRNPRKLGHYIAKYMTKLSPTQIPLSGRCWSASENLMRAKFPTYVLNGSLDHVWDKAYKLFRDQATGEDFWTYLPVSDVMQIRLMDQSYIQNLEAWKESVINPPEN